MRHRNPWRRLDAAEAAYLARFGEDASVAPYRAHPRLPDVLFDAVERGEQLTEVTWAERLGVAPQAAQSPDAVE